MPDNSQSERIKDMPQELESNLIATTPSPLPALEHFYEQRAPLILERNILLSSPVFFMRPSLKQRLLAIDSEIDSIELEMARLRQQSCGQDAHVNDFIENTKKEIEDCIAELSTD